MTMAYVRQRYQVPARQGRRVIVDGRTGVITSCDHGLRVRFDGDKRSTPCHPRWRVTYLDAFGRPLLKTEG